MTPNYIYPCPFTLFFPSFANTMGSLSKVRAMECVLLLTLFLIINLPQLSSSQLKHNYYADICPNVESIVRRVVYAKASRHFATISGTIRLFFHDCFVEGCDASIMIYSKDGGMEKDHEDNISVAGDSFDMVIRAKAKLDQYPSCKNRVSCADILAMATRDVISFIGGPDYEVELGRLDGLTSTNTSVTGKLPHPTFDLDQLNEMFSSNGLSQTDMIALSGAHTLGFSFCKQFMNRLYNFSSGTTVDPSINETYATNLKSQCPKNVDPSIAINMDPITPRKFDNMYYQNLQVGMGLFTSDQVLYTDPRSRATVEAWASNYTAFEKAFVTAMTKMGRVGVKTGSQGNIRRNCAVFN